jgi:hypothetical protein
MVDDGESCDPCPKTCADDGDADPCTKDEPMGTQCNVMCVSTRITEAKNGDGCCPRGADMRTDTDCKPVCGNGVVESQEDCDEGMPSDTCQQCKRLMPPQAGSSGSG